MTEWGETRAKNRAAFKRLYRWLCGLDTDVSTVDLLEDLARLKAIVEEAETELRERNDPSPYRY
jgi:hypothetical protein